MGALLGCTHETCSSAVANDELESILRGADGTWLAADLAQSCNELVGTIQWEAQHNPTFTDEAIQVCLSINRLFNSPLHHFGPQKMPNHGTRAAAAPTRRSGILRATRRLGQTIWQK